MAKSDLLKEAIADAKAVKETALANAKIALQEAFAPRMMRMISDQIENEVEGEEELPVAAPDDLDAIAGEQEGGDDFTWTDDSLSATVGGNDYDFTVGMGGEDDAEFDEPEVEDSEQAIPTDDDMNAEYNEGMNYEDDLELESIIRELEDGTETEEDHTEVEPMYEDDELPVENHYMGHDEEEEEDIDGIIESILRETEEEEAPDAEVVAELEDKLEDTEEKLEEAYRTVKQLKGIINEVNLLNAKLLYTNKLFRNFELSEGQKMKVIENFDRAGNPREVKLVFTTLAESFQRPTKKRVVKESYASRATATTAPSKKTTQVLNEGFELANRWKKLAGLL